MGVRVLERFEEIELVEFDAQNRLWDTADRRRREGVHRRAAALRRHPPHARTVIIPPRFNGPPDSANGGYACGLVSEALGGGFEVTLLARLPSVSSSIWWATSSGRATRDRRGAAAAHPTPMLPEPVSVENAREASKSYPGFEHHAYPTCFTCGPERDDGLGIFAGPVEGRDGIVASPWTPQEVRPEIVWAALDCPSGWAVDDFQREGVLLGRMAASPGDAGSGRGPSSSVGRSARTGASASRARRSSPRRELLAAARSTWIVPARERDPAQAG